MTTLARRLRRAFALLAAALVVAYLVGPLTIVEKVESGVSQFFALSIVPDHDDRVVTVAITEQNYLHLFGGRSPLAPGPLLHLLSAISRYHPAVIGVDLSSAAFTDHDVVPGGAPIIWARDAYVDDDRRLTLEPLRVRTPGEYSGIAVLGADADGVQRKYQRFLTTTEGAAPSFPYQVARTWQLRQARETDRHADAADRFAAIEGAKPTETLFVEYAHFRQPGAGGCPGVTATRVVRSAPRAFRPLCFTAQQVLDAAGFTKDQSSWNAQFENRVVLLGGTYAHGGDTSHSTPVGGLAGVEIMAHIVATELENRGRRPITTFGALVFFVLLAYLAVPLDRPLSSPVRLLRTLVVGIGAASLVSLIVHGSLAFTIRYLVVFVCVLILQALTNFLKSVTGEAVLAAAALRRYLWTHIVGLGGARLKSR